jgi:hypothetical protein
MKISVEKTPKQKLSQFVIDNVANVNITHLPNTSFQNTIDGIKEINDIAGRSIGIAHIGARNLSSEKELIDGLEILKMEKSDDVLIIGGGTPVSNIYPYSDAVYDFIKKSDFNFNMWCAVHPQEEEFINVLVNKYQRYKGGYNQLCLNPKILRKWDKKTRICVPTSCSAKGLWRYMKIVGLTQSIPYAVGNWQGLFYLNKNGFDTKKFIQHVGNIEHLHLYNFGQLDKTLDRLLK